MVQKTTSEGREARRGAGLSWRRQMSRNDSLDSRKCCASAPLGPCIFSPRFCLSFLQALFWFPMVVSFWACSCHDKQFPLIFILALSPAFLVRLVFLAIVTAANCRTLSFLCRLEIIKYFWQISIRAHVLGIPFHPHYSGSPTVRTENVSTISSYCAIGASCSYARNSNLSCADEDLAV